MSAHHGFDPKVAQDVGCNAAVIYQNIKYWCAKNAANDKNEYEGRHYTYNSVNAFCELFPYLSAKQIRTALDKLEERGYIGLACLNKSAYDRTKWYCDLRNVDLPLAANGLAPEGEPIPDINTDINLDTYVSMSISPNEAVGIWNEICVPAGLAKPRAKMPASRVAALKARLKAEGLDGWRQGCERLAASSFCRGENNNGWKADIDFLAGESGFAKVMEGRYDNRTGHDKKSDNTARHRSAFAAALSERGSGGSVDPQGEPDRRIGSPRLAIGSGSG
jgi:hypothetical protein